MQSEPSGSCGSRKDFRSCLGYIPSKTVIINTQKAETPQQELEALPIKSKDQSNQACKGKEQAMRCLLGGR